MRGLGQPAGLDAARRRSGGDDVVDVDKIVALDVHTHVSTSVEAPAREPSESAEAMARYFKTEAIATTVPQMADYYRARKMACVAFMVDATSAMGRGPSVTNEEIAALAAEHDDVIIPFGSVDPHAGRAAVAAARRLVEEHGVKGFKFHPNAQAFYPNDRAFYPLYELLEGLGVPALFHSGHTGAGAGVRGGSGIRLRYSNPMFLDDVAVDFPDLAIILAHPSFPWQDEAISVALHKPLVYIDLSGWSPKYFPASLIQYANTLLREKVLFGSDYPVITPDRWIADFEKTAIREEVRPLILKENALRLLKLKTAAASTEG
jgi:predicted TIM-barrel fold metal-dependent hydrolase